MNNEFTYFFPKLFRNVNKNNILSKQMTQMIADDRKKTEANKV